MEGILLHRCNTNIDISCRKFSENLIVSSSNRGIIFLSSSVVDMLVFASCAFIDE